MGAKLANWKTRNLSFAGRGILVRTVSQTLLSYAMQTYLLPKQLCKTLDNKLRDFWWGFSEQGVKHLYPKPWSTICVPKEVGGLGFRRMYDINVAFVTKLVWQLNTKNDKL